MKCAFRSIPKRAAPLNISLIAIIERSIVSVAPVIKVTNHMVAAPINSDVVLQCYVEASPRAMNTWYRSPGEK